METTTASFAALVVYGYEYHDDYVQTGSVSVTVDIPTDLWPARGFDAAVLAAEDVIFDLLDGIEDDLWCRVESVERVR